jgi:glucokinase
VAFSDHEQLMKISRKDYVASIDLGGTNMRVAAVDRDGVFLEERRIPTQADRGRDVVIERMCDLILDVTASLHKKKYRCIGVGVGVPGLVFYHRELHESPNFPGKGIFPVKARMEKRLPVEVLVENDANAAALGEVWKGAARGLSNACLLTLGTGVGSGIILDGKIWSGTRGTAAETGHMIVAPDGELCNCGSYGCVETFASATWMVRRAQAAVDREESDLLKKLFRKKERVTGLDVFRVAEAGDPAAKHIFHLAGRALGIAIANLTNILDLEKFIVAGGASNAWRMFAPAMKQEAYDRSYVYRGWKVPIVRSRLVDRAGLLGAARMVWQQYD